MNVASLTPEQLQEIKEWRDTLYLERRGHAEKLDALLAHIEQVEKALSLQTMDYTATCERLKQVEGERDRLLAANKEFSDRWVNEQAEANAEVRAELERAKELLGKLLKAVDEGPYIDGCPLSDWLEPREVVHEVRAFLSGAQNHP